MKSVGGAYWNWRWQLGWWSALAHGWWSYDTTECQWSQWEAPTRCGDGSWRVGMRWRAADGAMTQLSVREISRRRLLELAMTAGVMECVGARLMELWHDWVSMKSVGDTYRSRRWQLGCGSPLAHGWWKYDTAECQWSQ